MLLLFLLKTVLKFIKWFLHWLCKIIWVKTLNYCNKRQSRIRIISNVQQITLIKDYLEEEEFSNSLWLQDQN